MNSTYIGIDMGTSGVKLLLMDGHKRLLAQSSVEYEVSHPRDGWSEIDSRRWYDATVKGLRHLMAGQEPERVRAIGVTGQMHTLVLLGENGESLRPAMMWNDKRTAGLIPLLRRTLADGPDGGYLSGIVSTGSPAANLLWVSREEPEVFRNIRHFLIGPDYLVYRLTGILGTDFTEASTSSLYSISRREWLEGVRALIGLPESAYPPVRGSVELAGCLLPAAARELGLREDVRVIVGTGDNPATAVSTGCVGRGHPVLSLGTSGVLVFPVGGLEQAHGGKAILFSQDRSAFSCLVQAVVQSTGESVSWWTRKVLGVRSFGTLDGEITRDMIRGSRVLFYPHINGDKTIYADPDLRGAFINLGSGTGPAEMYYAVIEGLCFAVLQLARHVGLDLRAHESLKVVGGGAKSDLWLQTLASVLDIRVERLGGDTGPAFGVALLARAADLGGEQALATDALQIERTFEPDPEMVGLYTEKYERYLRIHDALKWVNDGTAAAP